MAATKTKQKPAKSAKTARPKTTRASGKVVVDSAVPFLWFEKGAEDAARYYTTIFKDSKITSATPMSVTFTIAGQEFYALNGGPSYKLTPAFSIFVTVKTQEQVDALWAALTEGGEESRCGWLVDRFGLSWQIIPDILPRLLSDKDPKRAQRAMKAMLKMQKLDIQALKDAANGA